MRVSLATLALPVTKPPCRPGFSRRTASSSSGTSFIRSTVEQTFEAPKIEGQTMVMGKVFGVVAFKDGRVGTKDFIYQV